MAVKIGLAQINTTVGDFSANCEKVRQAYLHAKKENIELLIFPELCICGYPPEDLLLKKSFLADSKAAVQKIAADCSDMTIMLGFAEEAPRTAYNSLAVLQNGRFAAVYRKGLLPNYGVFDEKRYFQNGIMPLAVKINDISVVCTICEDIWDLQWLQNHLSRISEKDLLVNISASPFHLEKIKEKLSILGNCAKQAGCPVAYCNLVGGQDELVFDGRSMLIGKDGKLAACAKGFEEDMLLAEIDKDGKIAAPQTELNDNPLWETYNALLLGTRDYVRKNGFKKVVIGLSGGIDSALTAALAVDAMGAENVCGITMPTKFNSKETISDAEKCAKNLGIKFLNIPLESTLKIFSQTLSALDGWKEEGIAYENLQARIRGAILMASSNKNGWLVLTTGNKSETAVGYSTLYGDTAGGFAVLKDVPKTLVYRLSHYINKIHNKDIIPLSVIERIPTAELRHNQKDSDTLPEYDTLDVILKRYIEEEKTVEQIIAEGLDSQTVLKTIKMVEQNEYKRRQSPPGVKITPKAFGKDRRMPITNHYRRQTQQK